MGKVKNNKVELIIIAALVLISTVSILFNIHYRTRHEMMLQKMERDEALPEILQSQLEISRMERDSIRSMYNQEMKRVDSLDTTISKSDQNLKSMKKKYYESINVWRTLPNDERVHFFTRELAKVDSIP